MPHIAQQYYDIVIKTLLLFPCLYPDRALHLFAALSHLFQRSNLAEWLCYQHCQIMSALYSNSTFHRSTLEYEYNQRENNVNGFAMVMLLFDSNSEVGHSAFYTLRNVIKLLRYVICDISTWRLKSLRVRVL